MLLPDNIEEFKSHGEYLLYFKFKKDNKVNDCYVLHSVFTNHHLNNVSGELDYLILAPGLGIFAIEVKHGGVRREDGTWIFENRHGDISRDNKGPFSQVNDTMHSIRNYIIDQVSHDESKRERLRKILFGNGVAFTSMLNQNIDFGPEAYPWQILTKEGLSLPISKYLETLSSGWHNKYKNKYWYDINESRPTKSDCELLLKIIRGDFESNYSEINKISDNEKLIEEFTKEQFQILDFVDFNDRCLIQGQAGTGKTVLALELVRRRLKKGDKVGFFCFNKQLGEKLSKSIEDNFNQGNHDYFVGTLHSYMLRNTDLSVPADNHSDFYSETLPLQFLIQNETLSDTSKFDLLVIDEAQDLLSNTYLEIFDFILENGLKDGEWVIFGDFTNQALYVNDPFDALEALSQKTFYTKLPPLKVNCRNTKKIAKQNTLLTGIEQPEFLNKSLPGESIEIKFPAANNQKEVIKDILETITSKGIPLSKVTLLSPKTIGNTFLSKVEFINDKRKEGLNISTIQSYKGLENTIIILYGFSELSSERSRKLLYVGISRATQKLYLVLDKSLEKKYQKIVGSNLSKLE